MTVTASQEDYRVNLEVFEGPLDLLLYLIKKNDLDAYDIPIAFILEEYVKYIDSLQEMDIDLAGEFLLMAAELTLIKSRMLLPGDEGTAEDADEEGDPRVDLVRRLLEYQRFKEASDQLMNRPMVGRDEFVRTEKEEVEADPDVPIEASVYDLVNAFSTILRRVPRSEIHQVAMDRISVNERIYQLMEAIKKDATVSLEELLPSQITRYDLVITFLAILEMARLKVIRMYQGGVHDTIRIRGTMESVEEEDMMRLVQIENGNSENTEG